MFPFGINKANPWLLEAAAGTATTNFSGTWAELNAGFNALDTTCVVAFKYGVKLPDRAATLIIFIVVLDRTNHHTRSYKINRKRHRIRTKELIFHL